ncbi:MAG: EI24 domain-containing protein [Saprospiraceae bacterium]
MLKDFTSAIKAYWEAWKIIVDQRLWLYLFVTGFISIFYGLLVGVSTWYWSDNLKDLVLNIFPSQYDSKILSRISSALVNVGIATTGIVIYKYVILVLLSPILSSLSRRIEEAVAGYSMSYNAESDETAIKDFIRASFFGIRKFSKEILFTVGFLFLGIIPVLNYLIAPLIFIIQSMYVGFCTMDFSLNRYFSVANSSDFIRKNLGISIGIGIVFMILILIPIVGLFFAPALGVAAATLKTVPRVYRPTYA